MAIVAFTYSKMAVERTNVPKGQVKIENNINVVDVQETDLSFGKSKQKALKFTFDFTSTYQPNIGKIQFVGDIVDLRDEKAVKEVVSAWKKDKKISTDMMKSIIGVIMDKCNIQALILAKEMNLPSPIPLPKVSGPKTEVKKK